MSLTNGRSVFWGTRGKKWELIARACEGHHPFFSLEWPKRRPGHSSVTFQWFFHFWQTVLVIEAISFRHTEIVFVVRPMGDFRTQFFQNAKIRKTISKNVSCWNFTSFNKFDRLWRGTCAWTYCMPKFFWKFSRYDAVTSFLREFCTRKVIFRKFGQEKNDLVNKKNNDLVHLFLCSIQACSFW